MPTFKPALVLASLAVRRERAKGLPRVRRGVVLVRVVVRLPNMAEGGLRLYLCINQEKEMQEGRAVLESCSGKLRRRCSDSNTWNLLCLVNDVKDGKVSARPQPQVGGCSQSESQQAVVALCDDLHVCQQSQFYTLEIMTSGTHNINNRLATSVWRARHQSSSSLSFRDF